MAEQKPDETEPPQKKPVIDPQTMAFIKRSFRQHPDLIIENPPQTEPDTTSAETDNQSA